MPHRILPSRPFARIWRTWPPEQDPRPLPQEGLPLGVFERYAAYLPRPLRNPARMIRNGLQDFRYGALLKGIRKTRFAGSGAFDTVNTDYSAMPYMFGNMIHEQDVLVDVGCGKGRVINWWLSCGYRNRMIGIELDGDVARSVRARLENYRNVTIIHGDAVENIPADGTLFFLFNAFSCSVTERFKGSFLSAFAGRNHAARIIYYCPESVQVFKDDPHFTVEEYRIEHLVQCGLQLDPFAVIRLKSR